MSYVYKYRTNPGETANDFTVGFYSPDGMWHQESEYKTQEAAAERVHWLNGGSLPRDNALDRRAMEQLAHAIRLMPHTVRMRP